jgi:hypothetical protein
MPQLEPEEKASKQSMPAGGKIEHFALEARLYVELDGPGSHSDAVRQVEDRLSLVMYKDDPSVSGPKIRVIKIEEVRTRRT